MRPSLELACDAVADDDVDDFVCVEEAGTTCGVFMSDVADNTHQCLSQIVISFRVPFWCFRQELKKGL